MFACQVNFCGLMICCMHIHNLVTSCVWLPFPEPFPEPLTDPFSEPCSEPFSEPFSEPIVNIDSWHSEDSGPLLNINGKTVAFAPLLRTRKTMNYGICHSSWTLYQPHALVWDYSFKGGKEAFWHSVTFRLGTGLPYYGNVLFRTLSG